VIVLATLVVLIGGSLALVGLDALDGPLQVALVMCAIVATLVYYGIQVLSPGWYYAATALICAIVSMTIGSSWTTAATVGVGLVGIATMLGVSAPITAGAVISGAYLGDKLSPLSETRSEGLTSCSAYGSSTS
jgi:NhaC family Na+:H+ antiporter